MISSHRIPPIAIYVSSGRYGRALFGRGRKKTKKATKRLGKESVQSKK